MVKLAVVASRMALLVCVCLAAVLAATSALVLIAESSPVMSPVACVCEAAAKSVVLDVAALPRPNSALAAASSADCIKSSMSCETVISGILFFC